MPHHNRWIKPSQTQASLREHINRLSSSDEDLLTVDAPTGRFRISRQGDEFVVAHFGTGGGWCWEETDWSLEKTVSYLSMWDDDPTYDEIRLRFSSEDDD